jgi:hypothetical protein
MKNRDSFDRFGDDLCELILSYLEIYYTFYYQCVSKQWSRLIYNRQSTLTLGHVNQV